MSIICRDTNPEPVVGTRMSEVNDKLEWLVVERLECQKNMVDQEVTIHIQNSMTKQPTKLYQST